MYVNRINLPSQTVDRHDGPRRRVLAYLAVVVVTLATIIVLDHNRLVIACAAAATETCSLSRATMQVPPTDRRGAPATVNAP